MSSRPHHRRDDSRAARREGRGRRRHDNPDPVKKEEPRTRRHDNPDLAKKEEPRTRRHDNPDPVKKEEPRSPPMRRQNETRGGSSSSRSSAANLPAFRAASQEQDRDALRLMRVLPARADGGAAGVVGKKNAQKGPGAESSGRAGARFAPKHSVKPGSRPSTAGMASPPPNSPPAQQLPAAIPPAPIAALDPRLCIENLDTAVEALGEYARVRRSEIG